jgi:hypothetical protein
MNELVQSNPLGVTPCNGQGVVYYARVVDDSGVEWRYIGKASSPRSRLRAYVNNVSRIQRGLPRRTTPGQEPYRGVHLALAKAVESGWEYEFDPLTAVEKCSLDVVEQQNIQELECNLNGLSSWLVKDYHATELKHLA